MKKKQKLLVALTSTAVVIIASLFLLKTNTASNNETREINKFLAQANIAEVEGWAVYPNCGDSGGRNDGYVLEVNNIAVAPEQAAKLKSYASSRGYTISERDDGYTVIHNNWSILALTKNRTDLFISINYPKKPIGFPEGGGVCN